MSMRRSFHRPGKTKASIALEAIKDAPEDFLALARAILDAMRNAGKVRASVEEKAQYTSDIASSLEASGVCQDLKAQVMASVEKADVLEELTHAAAVFHCLLENGFRDRGEMADEFLKGAHFEFNDGGKFYRDLKSIGCAAIRCSSHFRPGNNRQLEKTGEEGITCGRILPELLIIITQDQSGMVRSHFQAEASPWRLRPGKWVEIPNRGTLQTSEHALHFTLYALNTFVALMLGKSKENLGPYGWSEHHDANPIVDLQLEGPSSAPVSSVARALNGPPGDIPDAASLPPTAASHSLHSPISTI